MLTAFIHSINSFIRFKCISQDIRPCLGSCLCIPPFLKIGVWNLLIWFPGFGDRYLGLGLGHSHGLPWPASSQSRVLKSILGMTQFLLLLPDFHNAAYMDLNCTSLLANLSACGPIPPIHLSYQQSMIFLTHRSIHVI